MNAKQQNQQWRHQRSTTDACHAYQQPARNVFRVRLEKSRAINSTPDVEMVLTTIVAKAVQLR
jgi:hypothetical protein